MRAAFVIFVVVVVLNSRLLAAPASADWGRIGDTNRAGIVEIDVEFLTSGGTKSLQGTGFAVLDGGYVLTNRHLLEYEGGQLQHISASIGSRESARYQMRVVDTSPKLDLALLVFANTPKELRTLKRGNSHTLKLGDSVATFGFPKYEPGNDFRPSTGTLTSEQADIGNLTAGMEAEMTLYPGNSGGPLFNTAGEIIGIVVSRLNQTDDGRPESRVAYFLRIEQANSLISAAKSSEADTITSHVPSVPAEIKRFPSLQQLTLADIPGGAFTPLPKTSSADDLRARLQAYPSVELTQDTLRLEGSGDAGQKKVTLFFSRLVLDDSTLFVLNRDVVIVTGELQISRGHVRSFPPGVGEAASGRNATGIGEPGGNGTNGAASGSLAIYAVQKKEIQMDVDLSGQPGGHGGLGGSGNVGAKGRPGESGSDHLFDCARGPGNGEPGGTGGDGARGGRGGDGGDAGSVSIFVLEGIPEVRKEIEALSKGGVAGPGGHGGTGGLGGEGGDRGSSTTYCHGGSNGPPGQPGNTGPRGDDGNKGKEGTIRVVSPLSYDQFPDSWT